MSMTEQNKIAAWKTTLGSPPLRRCGRPTRIQPFELLVPRDIRLERDRLVWTETYDRDPETDGYRHVPTSPMAMDNFLKLSAATPQEILRYAKQWGPIGFCKHGLPASHMSRWGPDGTGRATCREFGGPDGYWEPLKSWRLTSRRALALLNIGARLSTGEPGAEEDWRVLDCAFINPGNWEQWRMVNQRILAQNVS